MDFALSSDQELLRDTARALMARECPTSLVRDHMNEPQAAAPLWEHLAHFAALGTGPTTDLCLFAEEAGFVAAPGPFFATTALFAPLLDAVGSNRLDATLAGELTGTVALAGDDGIWQVNADPVKTFVLEADVVDLVAIVGAGPSVTLVEQPAARRVVTMDSSRRVFEVDVAAVADGDLFALDPVAIVELIDRATVVLAAEMVGTTQRLFEMALEYAKQRYQFGVPIGSFSAIQHKLVDMSLDLERARAAVYYAAMAIDAGDDDRHRAGHVAKAAVGEAAKRAAKDGIQIHGGIGFTWEHDLHLFMRRAYASEALLGATGWHHDRLAELLF